MCSCLRHEVTTYHGDTADTPHSSPTGYTLRDTLHSASSHPQTTSILAGRPLRRRLHPQPTAYDLRRPLAGPLLGLCNGSLLVLLPCLGDVVGERVVGVGRAEERLDREEDGADLQRWGPLVLENVEADAAELVCGLVSQIGGGSGLGEC